MSQTSGSRHALSEQQIARIHAIADQIRYGTISLVFQDGRLVQIEHSEKIRLPQEKPNG